MIFEVPWHAVRRPSVRRPSDSCAASPVATALDRLLPRIEPHGAGLGTAAANLRRNGPIARRRCRPSLHRERTQQSP